MHIRGCGHSSGWFSLPRSRNSAESRDGRRWCRFRLKTLLAGELPDQGCWPDAIDQTRTLVEPALGLYPTCTRLVAGRVQAKFPQVNPKIYR